MAAIQKERRVFEMPARLLSSNMYTEEIYPLMDANPGQVALVLPADRIRFRDSQLDFIDSDLNSVDVEQTKIYTEALIDKGFVFPAKGVWGNFTTFKPFEGGTFVVDNAGKTYHILRKNNLLEVSKVPFSEGIVPQKMVIAESKDRKYLGLVLDIMGRMYLLHDNNFALTRIPIENYLAKNMDFKLIMDPLFITAVYSDDTNVHAVAFKNDDALEDVLTPIHTHTHQMSRSKNTLLGDISDILFPFSLSFTDMHNNKGLLTYNLSAKYLSFGLMLNVLLALAYAVGFRHYQKTKILRQSVFIVILGVYILIPLTLMEQYKDRN